MTRRFSPLLIALLSISSTAQATFISTGSTSGKLVEGYEQVEDFTNEIELHLGRFESLASNRFEKAKVEIDLSNFVFLVADDDEGEIYFSNGVYNFIDPLAPNASTFEASFQNVEIESNWGIETTSDEDLQLFEDIFNGSVMASTNPVQNAEFEEFIDGRSFGVAGRTAHHQLPTLSNDQAYFDNLFTDDPAKGTHFVEIEWQGVFDGFYNDLPHVYHNFETITQQLVGNVYSDFSAGTSTFAELGDPARPYESFLAALPTGLDFSYEYSIADDSFHQRSFSASQIYWFESEESKALATSYLTQELILADIGDNPALNLTLAAFRDEFILYENNETQFNIRSGSVNQSTPVNAVPEPGTLSLLALGIAGLGLARRRKNR